MIFSYNSFHQLETPDTYLAYPNKKVICALKPYDRNTNLRFVGCSEYTFSINKYVNGRKTPHYDDITIGKYIEFKGVAWFRIIDIEKNGDGKNEVMSVTTNSLECETGQTYITALGSLGTSEDNDGGLDLYCLYSSIDTTHSLMHLFVEKNPSWSIGYIDPEISKDYRIFDEDRIASYDLLMSTVAKSYECIFQFDTYSKTVSAYKLDNFGKVTSIYLAYRNLINSAKISCSEDDIKTVFYVTGGSDATGTPLLISDVNPGGNSSISNFEYFYQDMSIALQERLKAYIAKMEENAPLYQTAISKLQIMYDEYASLQNAHPDTEGSTDWTKYGSIHLKGKVDTYRSIMSTYNEDSTESIYQDAYINYTAASAELEKRNIQISAKEKEIENQQNLIKSYVINIYDFLGDELYKELSVYVREDVFTDSTFVATESMTDSEIFEMKQSLYEHAKNELKKVCFPQFDMEVDAINFPKIFKYREYTDQLILGNIITISLDNYSTIEARLLSISIDWDNADSFSLTFSSKSSLEDGVFSFIDVQGAVNKIGNSLNLSSSAWNAATRSSSTILADMSTFLNASMREVQNSVDNEVNIDGTGITVRKSNGNGTYDPNQLWMTRGNIVMTDDGWKSIKVAIGGIAVNNKRLYGLCADLLVGRTVLSENLQVVNDANNFTIDKNGLLAKATNNFSVSINPNNPSAIFTIKNGSNTVLGVDAATNKFVFKGTLESTDGKIGGFTIGATTLVAGTIGLASSGNIQMWAGNVNAANAPFKVYSDGSIYTNKIQITGGSFALGNNFSVDSAGNMKCSNADISGKITALVGGKIGAFTITQNGLKADSERVDIEWGNFYVSGDEAFIGNVTINNDGIDVGILSGNGYGGTFDSNGIIHSTEIYIEDPWWDGQSITQRVEELYNYVYYGGWCRGGDDCDDSCDNCDGGGCDGGGCKDEEHLADDIGAGC